jgi:hypothetical protein
MRIQVGITWVEGWLQFLGKVQLLGFLTRMLDVQQQGVKETHGIDPHAMINRGGRQ